MSSILIKESLIGGATQDLLIVDNRIDKIGTDLLPIDEDTIILDGRDKAVVPGLCNGHTPVSYTHLDVYKRQDRGRKLDAEFLSCPR